MSSKPHWNPGDTVVLRGTFHGILLYGGPAFCVRDEPELVALYWPAGIRVRQFPRRMTARDMLTLREANLTDHTWTGTDVLMLSNPSEGCSIWLMWETGTTDLRCWYINLEEPLKRTRVGFDAMDWQLDIVVSPDRSRWRWKDEDEFEAWIAAGLITPTAAESIRATGLAALKRLQENRPPYCDGWENWRPPAAWGIPALPVGWDRL